MSKVRPNPTIDIVGARQHNLKNLNLSVETGRFVTVVGPTGSGKSSLVFDTLFAEGQRRYVETFSPYARQFIDRLPRPKVDRIDGILPALAIEHDNKVRTPRSTVGTITGLLDRFKLLFAQRAKLFCPGCGEALAVRDAEATLEYLNAHMARFAPDERWAIGFEAHFDASLNAEHCRAALAQQGYTHILGESEKTSERTLTVAVDRFRFDRLEKDRTLEAIRKALTLGHDRAILCRLPREGEPECVTRFGGGLFCGHCNVAFEPADASLFSFNSPVGACEGCKGYGQMRLFDATTFVKNDAKPMAAGGIHMTDAKGRWGIEPSLLRSVLLFHGINPNASWDDLTVGERRWFVEGDVDEPWEALTRVAPERWPGVLAYIEWLRARSYKLKAALRLSVITSWQTCPVCKGSRLKAESMAWRWTATEPSKKGAYRPFTPAGFCPSHELPGFNFQETVGMDVSALAKFVKDDLAATSVADKAERLLLEQIDRRLTYLLEVGLGYLTLDRLTPTLSGGEVQRLTLTQALGTGLSNTLFLIDEPSTGLHPKDLTNIARQMRRLSENGNTVMAIEHDPQLMLAGDRVIELGPEGGEAGGHIVLDAAPERILTEKPETATADYLVGRRVIRRSRAKLPEADEAIVLTDVTRHNLKHVNLKLPLSRLTVVTGVSGSGKSTLITEVLPAALEYSSPYVFDVSVPRRMKAIVIDQSPVTTQIRSTPASFLGFYDHVRRWYAQAAQAQGVALTPGDFSFNTGSGRCPHCKGSGIETVEMQFLSDVSMPCPHCRGTRFGPKALSVKVEGVGSIADFLNMDADAVADCEAVPAPVRRAVAGLRALGLGRLRVGQALPTLSTGELQRLKLAQALATELDMLAHRPAGTRLQGLAGRLLIFDEPTSGLHLRDVERFVKLCDELVEAGMTIVVIEHQLDVIANADHVIELGPEGGDKGGEIVFEGTPEALAQHPEFATGAALAAWRDVLCGKSGNDFFNVAPEKTRAAPTRSERIAIHGARENNLKNLDAHFPQGKLCVVTGPSGSGKSTLAFRLLFAEGQRRFIDNLSAYARSRLASPPIPDYDEIEGLPPTVSIEQRTSRGGWRSTAGTMTEIYHYLRLLFARLGETKSDKGLPLDENGRVDPRLFSYNSPLGACPKCLGYGFLSAAVARARRRDEDDDSGGFADELAGLGEDAKTCGACAGLRLKPEALAVRWAGYGIADFCSMTFREALNAFESLAATWGEHPIAGEPVAQITSRLKFLCDVGLDYLTLDRAAPTLSGGEAQRLRLATQIGSNLQGACYVLDEPTIGLHQSDNTRLIRTMRGLTERGNTLVVVEHDEETIRAADWIVDIGPGAGAHGGTLMYEGDLSGLMKVENSLTAQALSAPAPKLRGKPAEPPKGVYTLEDVKLRNLKIPKLDLPLGRFVVVAGVSGSGKSTLLHEVLKPALERELEKKSKDRIVGRVCEVTQSPIGGSLYSCPATYVDFAVKLRELFAGTPQAQERGFASSQFSFQVSPGRCPQCRGSGFETLEMRFLPDVRIVCRRCHGRRFSNETLAVKWHDKDFAEILDMSIEEGAKFFEAVPGIGHPLKLLDDIGLGYLKIGHPTSMISGGEAQRLKLACELVRAREGTSGARRQPHTVYILDEPTVGLHMQDVQRLLGVLDRLVAIGHTVIVIEHNLDVVAHADHVIELGPGGGPEGGKVVAECAPAELKRKKTPTGLALKAHVEAKKAAH